MDILTANGQKLDPTISYIAVPENVFKNLVADHLRYIALDGGGVDDWEWTAQSFYDFKVIYAKGYGDKFVNWVEKRKDPNITIDQYIKSVMDFEDLAEFEIELDRNNEY